MSTFWIAGIGAGYLVFLALLLFVVRPKANAKRIQVVVNSVGLPLTSEIEPRVKATLRREVWIGFLSIAVALALASGSTIVAKVTVPGQVFFIDFTAVLLAIGISSAVVTGVREDARQRSQVRFARLRSVTIGDYRSWAERWAPRVVVVLSLAVFAFRVVASPGGAGSTPAFLFVYAGAIIVSLAIYEVTSRTLVRRGQPAGSALELAWDDALRSRALNAIAIAPMYLAAYFNIASIAFYPNSRGPAAVLAVDISALTEILFAAGLLVWIIGTSSRKPQQRYLRRLWPEFVQTPIVAGPSAAPTA